MSVKGYSGRQFWIVLNDEILAGVRSKTAAMPRSIIDRSDEEFDGWRHLEPIPESTSLQIDVAGVAKPDNFSLLQEWKGSSYSDVYLRFVDGTVVQAADGAFLQSLEYTGEYRGHATFSAVFLFSGLVTIIESILLTSKMYAIEFDDVAHAAGGFSAGGRFMPQFSDDAQSEGATIESGSMVNPVTTYSDWPPDNAQAEGATINSGEMDSPTTVYENWPPDNAQGEGATINSGEMVNPVVTYSDWPPDEARGEGGTINSGDMRRTFEATILARSPTLYWRFGEGTGTSIGDTSGNGNTGTRNTGTAWLGDSLVDESGDDAVDITSTSGGGVTTSYVPPNGSSARSFAFSFRYDGAEIEENDVTFLWWYGNLSNQEFFGVSLNGFAVNGTLGALRLNLFGGRIVWSTPVDDGLVHHALITTDGTFAGTKLYLDGVEESQSGSSSITINTAATALELGTEPNATNPGWNGPLDEFAVFDTELSVDDAEAFYAAI